MRNAFILAIPCNVCGLSLLLHVVQTQAPVTGVVMALACCTVADVCVGACLCFQSIVVEGVLCWPSCSDAGAVFKHTCSSIVHSHHLWDSTIQTLLKDCFVSSFDILGLTAGCGRKHSLIRLCVRWPAVHVLECYKAMGTRV